MCNLLAMLQDPDASSSGDKEQSTGSDPNAATPDMDLSVDGITSWISQGLESLIELGISYTPRLILALVVLVVGWIVIKIVRRGINRVLGSKRIDASVSSFLGSVAGVVLWMVLALSVLSMIGVEVTSFLAIFTAGALAIGLALKGTLQNFAAGVLLLIKHPFHVGDFIECAGVSGTVKEIRFFDTLITTADNVNIIVPNNDLSTKVVKNFSGHSTRRMQVVVGIGYEDDIDKARGIIASLLEADDRFLKDPECQIAVSELGDSSVNLQVRAWTARGDLSAATWDFNEQVKKAFDREGINLPYPQMDIHKVGDG
ncbi:MAG: mechanosensitive ion channel [Phycisphaerales bacterium]|nr:mechanosensitive ion channel [Phycisphaerales bacterium]